ncbi:hypothetical protein PLESTM_001441500 [Pleodorina starrii]|nr:hypothetical protein PLESTM_001441500 [Pleodorina starrii]
MASMQSQDDDAHAGEPTDGTSMDARPSAKRGRAPPDRATLMCLLLGRLEQQMTLSKAMSLHLNGMLLQAQSMENIILAALHSLDTKRKQQRPSGKQDACAVAAAATFVPGSTSPKLPRRDKARPPKAQPSKLLLPTRLQRQPTSQAPAAAAPPALLPPLGPAAASSSSSPFALISTGCGAPAGPPPHLQTVLALQALIVQPYAPPKQLLHMPPPAMPAPAASHGAGAMQHFAQPQAPSAAAAASSRSGGGAAASCRSGGGGVSQLSLSFAGLTAAGGAVRPEVTSEPSEGRLARPHPDTPPQTHYPGLAPAPGPIPGLGPGQGLSLGPGLPLACIPPAGSGPAAAPVVEGSVAALRAAAPPLGVSCFAGGPGAFPGSNAAGVSAGAGPLPVSAAALVAGRGCPRAARQRRRRSPQPCSPAPPSTLAVPTTSPSSSSSSPPGSGPAAQGAFRLAHSGSSSDIGVGVHLRNVDDPFSWAVAAAAAATTAAGAAAAEPLASAPSIVSGERSMSVDSSGSDVQVHVPASWGIDAAAAAAAWGCRLEGAEDGFDQGAERSGCDS